MFTRMVRKMVVGFGLATVAGVAAAGALGLVDGRHGSAEVELLGESVPVMSGDLGEVTVVASRHDLPEVVVAAQRVPVADGVMAEVTVTAKRAAPAVVELALVAGLPAGALVQ
jgi:hypothetical protein